MRNFIAKIVAAMRRMGHYVTVMVKKGGQWLATLQHVPAAPEADAADSVPDMTPSRADDLQAVRELAKTLAAGIDADPALLQGVPDMTIAWLKAMDRRGLCTVVTAKDEQLAAHLRGRAAIKGLVPYDREAIADVAASKDQPRPRDRQPTLRDLLEERAGVSLAA